MTARLLSRVLPIGLVAWVGIMALGACSSDDTAPTGVAAQKTATSGSTSTSGTVNGAVDARGATLSTPTPAPTATPTPAPTATPTPTVYVAYALGVSLTPQAATIGVQPAGGATPYQSTTTSLVVDVLMSNGAHVSSATWTSSNVAIATVNANGMVTAGSQTGTVTITATSLDGKAAATASITVVSDGGAAVSIQ